ncbi:MAG TPA: hypothetical protein VJU83_01555 [Burkholderiales bacterium]|nr:hypothetical protein [Burkholderiales bacterium]
MWRISWRFALGTFIPAAIVLGLALLAGQSQAIPIADLFRDTASVGKLPPLTGLVSNLGILLWCVAGTVSLVAWAMFRWAGDQGWARFFLASGLLSFLLMSDDLLQIHERLAFAYFGIREKHVLMLLAAAAGTYLLVYRKRILTTNYGMLVVALILMSIAVVVDRLFPHEDANSLFLLYEDGPKFLGIAGWCAYYCRTAVVSIQKLVTARAPGA